MTWPLPYMGWSLRSPVTKMHMVMQAKKIFFNHYSLIVQKWSCMQIQFHANSTRWVAVYLETHSSIGLKWAFPTGVLDSWHHCLLIYWRNVAQLPRQHRFVYWPLMIAANLCSYLSGAQHTAQGKDFELILTVKMETRYPVGGPFGREFSAFVIIAELWQPEVARPGNF